MMPAVIGAGDDDGRVVVVVGAVGIGRRIIRVIIYLTPVWFHIDSLS